MTNRKCCLQSHTGTFRLDVSRSMTGMRVVVDGIIGIGNFSKEEILLKSHSGKVTICGSNLNVGIFEGHAVEIRGDVEDIKFAYNKTKQKSFGIS